MFYSNMVVCIGILVAIAIKNTVEDRKYKLLIGLENDNAESQIFKSCFSMLDMGVTSIEDAYD